MCRFAPVRDPELPPGGEPTHATKVCDGTGDLPACMLCPNSLTYWRLTHTEPVADPWSGKGESTMTGAVSPADKHAGEIDCSVPVMVRTTSGEMVKAHWTTVSPWKAKPCTLCLKPTTLVSPKGVYIHKTCADRWNAGERRFAEPV